MNHHALIISPDCIDTNTTASVALRKIITQLEEKSFEVTCTISKEDGDAALEAHRDVSVLILDWSMCDAEAKNNQRQILQKTMQPVEEGTQSQLRKMSMPSDTFERPDNLRLLRYRKLFTPSNPLTPKAHDFQPIQESGGDYSRELLEQMVKIDINLIREHNKDLPIFLWTTRMEISAIPVGILQEIDGYIWKAEDSPSFIAGRIQAASREFHGRITPPFFKALVKHVEESNYAWHTPGHMGGIGFLKSAVGRGFYEFFGENMLRADLSVSVPQLGSLLDHNYVVKQAETEAARIFGASRTYFVTNGTSTSNQIVFHGTVNRGDVVLIDRNCHKTSMQAIVAIGCIPIYLNATTNELGIIGPVPESELTPESIRTKIDECPLIPFDQKEQAFRNIKLAVLTNSTYDGICYDTTEVEKRLAKLGIQNIMFDEAWSCYAKFHDFFQRRFGMHVEDVHHSDDAFRPQVFSTQSTHKVLTALSQGSMIHVRNIRGDEDAFHDRFNEAFMMHTSTSPQYSIIASLDIATRTMNLSGASLIGEALTEALTFRENLEQIGSELKAKGQWWFKIWQPEGGAVRRTLEHLMAQEPKEAAGEWELRQHESWHGFSGRRSAGYALLDPTKVTLYTDHIPASVVSAFLMQKGIFVEKTGATSFLVLFTVGITRGNLGTLISGLFDFKRAYDADLPVSQVLPAAALLPISKDGSMGLKEFCLTLRESLPKSLEPGHLPQQVLRPSVAYEHLVSNNLDLVPVAQLQGRVAAKILVPYPPAIPLVMPGEAISKRMVDFLESCEQVTNAFPGFGIDLHGIEHRKLSSDGSSRFYVYCVRGFSES